MIHPPTRKRTTIINIEQDHYANKTHDPYYRVQRNKNLFYLVMVVIVSLFVFWLSVKFGD